jgi:hypothetical protein
MMEMERIRKGFLNFVILMKKNNPKYIFATRKKSSRAGKRNEVSKLHSNAYRKLK